MAKGVPAGFPRLAAPTGRASAVALPRSPLVLQHRTGDVPSLKSWPQDSGGEAGAQAHTP